MSSNSVISVQNISKRYEIYSNPRHRLQQMLFGRFGRQYFHEFWALRDVSFEVHKGECIGVIGKNGAGKSTLLQILVGTLQSTTGSVEIQGRVAALLELGSGFNPEFTGKENVYMNATILGLKKTEIDACYQEILNFADIGDFISQPVKTYSSGMMVRLAFAVQVMVKPDILIVDEALAVGDIFFQQKCLARIKKIVAEGTTVFFVSHDLGAVRSFCHSAIYLKEGRIARMGTASDICDAFLNDTTVPRLEAVDRDDITSECKLIVGGGHPYREDLEFYKRCTENSGTQDVNFTAVDFYTKDGKTSQIFEPGDIITVVASYKALKAISKGAAMGLLIRDIQNTPLLAINTNSYNVYLGELNAGRSYTTEWTFKLPLNPNIYLISLGLKPHEDSQSYYQRVFNVASFQIVKPKNRIINTGYINLPDCTINIFEKGSKQ